MSDPVYVKIDGAQVDIADPCALYQALYAVKVKLLANETVEEITIRSPVTQRQMRLARTNMAELNSELSRLAAACQKKNGGTGRRAITFG